MNTGNELHPFQGKIRLFRQYGSCQIVLSLQGEVLTETGLQASISFDPELQHSDEENHPSHEWAGMLLIGEYYGIQVEPVKPEADMFRAEARLDHWSREISQLKLSLSFRSTPPALQDLLKNLVLQATTASVKNPSPKARKRFAR